MTNQITPQPNQDSFDPELSILLDLAIQYEETLRDALTKARMIRKQLEELVPNSPFKDFIKELDI